MFVREEGGGGGGGESELVRLEINSALLDTLISSTRSGQWPIDRE